MSERSRARWTVTVVLCALLGATAFAQSPGPPPPSPGKPTAAPPLEDAHPTPPPVDTFTPGARDRAAFAPVEIKPIPFEAEAMAVVDMSRVPTTPELASPLLQYSHIQGGLAQSGPGGSQGPRLPGEAHRQPAAVVQPPPEQSEERGPEATRAPGAWVVGFDGQPYSGWIPPDTMMAVGPEYVIMPLNSGFTVYAKTGQLTRAYTDFETFVNLPSPWNGFCYDPRVIYDTDTGHFLMMIMGKDTTNLKSYFWLMASHTSNPNGGWYVYRYDVTSGSTGAWEWLDFAGIGADHWGIYVTGNYFLFGGGYQKTTVRSVNRGVFSGGASNGYVWGDVRWPNNDHAFSVQMAAPHTQNASGNTFLINTYSGSGTQVCLWTLSGDRYASQGIGSPGLSRVAIDARTYYAMFENVDQPGSSYDLDGGDCRVGNAVYSQGKVYTTFSLNWNGARAYSEAYIAAFNAAAGTKAWDYALWNADYNLFYPAVAVEGTDTSPNWAVTMSRTEPGIATGWVDVTTFVFDPATDTYAYYQTHPGLGPYTRFDNDGVNRWGDYSMAAYDWTCGNVWGAGEYATASNTWATQLYATTIDDEPQCAYSHVISPNGGGSLTAGSIVTVSWSRMNIPAGDEQWVRFYDGSLSHDHGPFSTSATSYSWQVPNIPTATGSIIVGAWDPIASHWDTYDGSDATFTVVGMPDLEPSSLIPATYTIPSSGSMGVYNRVANSGTVTAGAFAVELRLSSNNICSTGDTFLATRSISSLTSGALNSSTTSITIPVATPPGTWYLCMLVDPGGAVAEFSESNNSSYVPLTIVEGTVFIDDFENGSVSNWSNHLP